MLPIVSAPHEVLAEKARPIKKIDKSVLDLVEQMKETLAATHDPEGIGLAAPQVGVSLQLFIIKPTPKAIEKVFINPHILENKARGDASEGFPKERSSFAPSKTARLEEALVGRKRAAGPRAKKTPTRLEGCLSLPQIWGEVVRYPSLTVTYLDPEGKTHTEEYSGFTATIIQHEYDHLQGILFPRRVLEQKGKLYKSKKNDKGEEIFEEITV